MLLFCVQEIPFLICSITSCQAQPAIWTGSAHILGYHWDKDDPRVYVGVCTSVRDQSHPIIRWVWPVFSAPKGWGTQGWLLQLKCLVASEGQNRLARIYKLLVVCTAELKWFSLFLDTGDCSRAKFTVKLLQSFSSSQYMRMKDFKRCLTIVRVYMCMWERVRPQKWFINGYKLFYAFKSTVTWFDVHSPYHHHYTKQSHTWYTQQNKVQPLKFPDKGVATLRQQPRLWAVMNVPKWNLSKTSELTVIRICSASISI